MKFNKDHIEKHFYSRKCSLIEAEVQLEFDAVDESL
uniref:Uncharacterized protein n=1 Tax=Tetranychus urticae TaxID=32264 RepID=T1K3P2_TETUR